MSEWTNDHANLLRKQLESPGMLVAPGAYDCLTAMLIERAGFGAVYLSGGATAAKHGLPDYGLATMTEVVESAAQVAGAVRIPLIADADTGYGNELNVIRTVREFERKGVAAIQIEDQTFPKRCGHLDGKEITSRENFASKIRAAADARRDPATVIVARTDARSLMGLDEAVERVNLAIEAGADVAFVEALESDQEIADLPRLVEGPCLHNVARGGKSPMVDIPTLEELGYKIAILPGLLLMTVIGACEVSLEEVQETGAHPAPPKDLSVKEAFQRVGAGAWDELRLRYDAVGDEENEEEQR